MPMMEDKTEMERSLLNQELDKGVDPLLVKKCKYLRDFIESDGWKLIQEEIKKQIYDNTVAFGSKTEMSSTEIDYRRGGLLMLSGFLDFPHRLLEAYENQLPIENK